MSENGKLTNLPNGWCSIDLQTCVDILDGRRVPVNSSEREARILGKRQEELFPYYGATGKVGVIDGYLFDEETVLVGEDGAPFLDAHKKKAYLARGKYWVNNHAHVLRARHGLTSNTFVQHYLNIFDYHGYVTGTTRLKLNQAPLRSIPTPLPPLAEQYRIVAKIEELFTRLDAGVEALKQIKRQLKRYRQAVLKHAFEGKLTQVWREAQLKDPNSPLNTEPAAVLLERIKAERKKALAKKYKELPPVDTTDLPDLPKGWEWTSVAQIGTPREQTVLTGPFGSTLGRSDFLSEGVPLLTIGCLTRYGLTTEKAFFISEEKAKKLGRYRVKKGDILFSRMATVGRAALVDTNFVNAVINYHLMRLRLADSAIKPEYMVYYVRGSDVVRNHVKEVNHGATRDGINTNQLLDLPVCLASRFEQEQIVQEVEMRFSIADAIESEIDRSALESNRLRQSILKRAFEGKLVPQDPNDEPAEKLLERIRAEREAEQNQKKNGKGSGKMSVKKSRVKAKN